MGKNLIQQARGKGHPRYKSPGHRFLGPAKFAPVSMEQKAGKVIDLVDCPGHDAPLMQVEYSDGTSCLIQAPAGIKVGDIVGQNETSKLSAGSISVLKDIPEGTEIYNIESTPGDGGKFCRSTGMSAKIVAKTEDSATILLPSKKTKIFNLNCRACVGIVAGSGRTKKPFLKAGTKWYRRQARNLLYPRISAGAQNAVDHPFGNKRTSRKAKQKAVGHFAPPGRKVGKFWPRRTGRKK